MLSVLDWSIIYLRIKLLSHLLSRYECMKICFPSFDCFLWNPFWIVFVPWMWQTIKSCFLNQSASLCVLMTELQPFILRYYWRCWFIPDTDILFLLTTPLVFFYSFLKIILTCLMCLFQLNFSLFFAFVQNTLRYFLDCQFDVHESLRVFFS